MWIVLILWLGERYTENSSTVLDIMEIQNNNMKYSYASTRLLKSKRLTVGSIGTDVGLHIHY
jgi:hypothetical protein